MPSLADRLHCSGCTACQSVCPRSAIEMVADREGFSYPQVNVVKCAQCGLCEKVCPSLHRDSRRTPLVVYAAMAKDDELRLKSSSGGVFSLLARQVLVRGGIVYGAGFDSCDWHVMHKSAESEIELEDLRGSKYVQSDVQGIYASVKKQLLSGREVMFSGTPCQISGLKHYLGMMGVNVEKLLLVDVICHAAPSPMVWRKYLDERLAKAGPGAIIRRISSRHKNCGWKRFSLSLRFANDKEYLCEFCKDPFMQAFLKELCNRPSCYSCSVRGLRSGSDITIGDYWGVSNYHPEMDDDCGTSLVLANTEQGLASVEAIMRECRFSLSTYKQAVAGNSALEIDHQPHRNRRSFLRKCRRVFPDNLLARMLKPSLVARTRAFAGRCLRKLGFRK